MSQDNGELTPHELLLLYCAARQAERSIDAVLHAKWTDLQRYYDGDRRSFLREAAAQAAHRASPVRHELSFVASALSSALDLIEEESAPSAEELIAARSRLHRCQMIVEKLGEGRVSFTTASAVEHFNCSNYVRHFSPKEVINRS